MHVRICTWVFLLQEYVLVIFSLQTACCAPSLKLLEGIWSYSKTTYNKINGNIFKFEVVEDFVYFGASINTTKNIWHKLQRTKLRWGNWEVNSSLRGVPETRERWANELYNDFDICSSANKNTAAALRSFPSHRREFPSSHMLTIVRYWRPAMEFMTSVRR